MIEIEPQLSEGDKARRRAYLNEFVPGIVGYGLVLAAVLAFVDEESSTAWIWMLAPLVPSAWIIRAVARDLRRGDEFTRLRQLEAMAVGFGAMVATSLTLGFLGVAGIETRAAGWICYGVGMAAWGVTVAVRSRADRSDG
jgi:hypothetical protein